MPRRDIKYLGYGIGAVADLMIAIDVRALTKSYGAHLRQGHGGQAGDPADQIL